MRHLAVRGVIEVGVFAVPDVRASDVAAFESQPAFVGVYLTFAVCVVKPYRRHEADDRILISAERYPSGVPAGSEHGEDRVFALNKISLDVVCVIENVLVVIGPAGFQFVERHAVHNAIAVDPEIEHAESSRVDRRFFQAFDAEPFREHRQTAFIEYRRELYVGSRLSPAGVVFGFFHRHRTGYPFGFVLCHFIFSHGIFSVFFIFAHRAVIIIHKKYRISNSN